MSYVLVYWDEENCYSVIHRKKVLSALENGDIVGKNLPILWAKETEPQLGTIINIGSKKKMRKEEEINVKVADDKSFCREELEQEDFPGPQKQDRTPKRNKSATVCDEDQRTSKISKTKAQLVELYFDPGNGNEIPILANSANINVDVDQSYEQSVLAVPRVVNDSEPNTSNENRHEQLLYEKNQIIRHLEQKLAKSEQQNRVFKKMIKQQRPEDSETDDGEMEVIGEGVLVKKAYMDYLKLGFRSKPSQFFRQLLFESGLFQLEEIANSSFNGKWQNRTSSGRPGLDHVKLRAIKEATIAACGLKEKTWEMAEFEKKITSVCGDARKKLKHEAWKITN